MMRMGQRGELWLVEVNPEGDRPMARRLFAAKTDDGGAPPLKVSNFEGQPEPSVEEAIAELAGKRSLLQPGEQLEANQPLVLPSYVKHAEDTPEVGKLTAEAVLLEYEQTAKMVEELAQQLTELQRRLEAEVASVHKVNQELRECAERARAEGKAAFDRIEAQSKLTAEIRESCSAMTAKLFSNY